MALLRHTAAVNPDTPVPTTQKAKPWAWIITTCAVLLAAAGAATFLLLRHPATATPAPDATPVISGISRPDSTCVTTDGTDRREYWDGNGWWAGRIDGDPKQMPAHNVLALKLQGHQINSVWICAPRSNG